MRTHTKTETATTKSKMHIVATHHVDIELLIGGCVEGTDGAAVNAMMTQLVRLFHHQSSRCMIGKNLQT